MDGLIKETEQWIKWMEISLRWVSDPQGLWVTVFPKQFYMKVHLLPQNLSETRTQRNLNDPTVHGHISLAVSLPRGSTLAGCSHITARLD